MPNSDMTRLALSVDEMCIHIECLAYDEGQRHALREQMRILQQLAAKQAQRSHTTSRRHMAGEREWQLHIEDANLWIKLSEACEPLEVG